MNTTANQFDRDNIHGSDNNTGTGSIDQKSPRRPAIAALMSTILPGFGQLYNGQVNKAIWLYLIFCLLACPLIVLVALYLPVKLTTATLVLSLVATLGLWFYGIVDAARQAKHLSHYRLQQWQSSGMYVAVFFVCNIIVLPLVINWIRDHQVQAFNIPTSSMAPTILHGDMLFANKSYNCPYCRREVSRGDIAIFVYPDNRNRYYIKRVLALPGDEVRVTSDGLFINNAQLGDRTDTSAPYTTESIGNKAWQVDWGDTTQEYDVTVTPGHAFVLGDNRSNSTDSKDFGLVPLSDVVGLSRQVWFSKGADGIRWSRLGLALHSTPVSH